MSLIASRAGMTSKGVVLAETITPQLRVYASGRPTECGASGFGQSRQRWAAGISPKMADPPSSSMAKLCSCLSAEEVAMPEHFTGRRMALLA
jgi:hypothetical protein